MRRKRRTAAKKRRKHTVLLGVAIEPLFFTSSHSLSLSLSQEGQPKERRKNEDAFDSFGGGGGDKSEGVLLNNRAHKEGFFFLWWILLGFTGFYRVSRRAWRARSALHLPLFGRCFEWRGGGSTRGTKQLFDFLRGRLVMLVASSSGSSSAETLFCAHSRRTARRRLAPSNFYDP